MIRVSKLKVTKFRNFTPGSVYNIGPCITLIAGINGTSKSTLLGMIAQPLGFPHVKSKEGNKGKSVYTRAYDNVDLYSYKTLANSPFKASYSDVFRMSRKYDTKHEHEYNLYLEGDGIDDSSNIINDGLIIRSEGRKDQKNNNLRFVTNTLKRGSGWGNFPHPVIYLGLERLRPLSTLHKKDIIVQSQLSVNEQQIWSDIYKYVMISNGNEKIFPESLETGNNFKKTYLSVETTYFDGESASAGQDNLGQIITAIISFYRLKKQLGDSYQGGMLLIDEFDATLHPIAQLLLLEKFIAYAKKLNLQIVSTTHSLTVIEHALQKCKDNVILLYLQKQGQKIIPQNGVDYDFVLSDLANISKKAKLKPLPKTTVLFEDSIGRSFFEQITGNIFKQYIETYSAIDNRDLCLSNGVLKNIAEHLAPKKIPAFSNIIFVLDPDSGHLSNSKTPNLLVLPGPHKTQWCIEKIINLFLLNLQQDDELWAALGLSFSQCMARYNNIENDPTYPKEQEKKKQYKNWFLEQLNNGNFGKNGTIIFRLWGLRNKEFCLKFCNEFLNALLHVKSPLVVSQQQQIKTKIELKFGQHNDLGLVF